MKYKKKSFQILDGKPKKVKVTILTFKNPVSGEERHIFTKVYEEVVVCFNETIDEIYLSFVKPPKNDKDTAFKSGLVSMTITK